MQCCVRRILIHLVETDGKGECLNQMNPYDFSGASSTCYFQVSWEKIQEQTHENYQQDRDVGLYGHGQRLDHNWSSSWWGWSGSTVESLTRSQNFSFFVLRQFSNTQNFILMAIQQWFRWVLIRKGGENIPWAQRLMELWLGKQGYDEPHYSSGRSGAHLWRWCQGRRKIKWDEKQQWV